MVNTQPTWHLEALTNDCRKALGAIAKQAFLKDFYLAGGTGLALQFGHRVSVDLDFFTNKKLLDSNDRQSIIKQLKSIGGFSLLEEREGAFHSELFGARVSLIHYDYPLLTVPKRWNTVAVASPKDIGLMKIGAIIGRGSKKDFIDLYFICKRGTSLDSLLKSGRRKFPHARDLMIQALKALVFFKDAERERMPRMVKDTSWSNVRRWFEKEVRTITSRLVK